MRRFHCGGLLMLGAVATAIAAPVPDLPPPAPTVFRLPQVVPWPDATLPRAPAGFQVERFATGLDNPRWPLVLANGDILVAQSRTESMSGMPADLVAVLHKQGVFGPSANSILLLRPGRDGLERHVLVEGLHQPFGMVLHGDHLYVANTDALVRFPFRVGDTRVTQPPETVLALPAGPDNNHWTRNVIVTPDGAHLLVSVGAATNVNEERRDPPDRAAIWEIRPDGSGKRLFATGLRNPVGMAFAPGTGTLWATVNERDGLGPDVPPDYLTRVVDGAFYGWPQVYFGTYADPTWQKLDPVAVREAQRKARVPDVALGAHSVPLGLHFYRGRAFPERYRHGAFIARRGGGSRVEFLGFDVIFIPFDGGAPSSAPEPFLTGFIADMARGQVHGRPVGLAELDDGSLLVVDDAGNTLWRVTYGAE